MWTIKIYLKRKHMAHSFEELNKKLRAEELEKRRKEGEQQLAESKAAHEARIAKEKEEAGKPRNFLKRIQEKGASDDPAVLLRDIKTYHPDKWQGDPENYPIVTEIARLLIERFKTIRLGEETIPDEYKRFWPTFRAVLESSHTREAGLEELYRACAEYREGRDYAFPLDRDSAANVVPSGDSLDMFLSLTLFLDVTLGHAAYARGMGVQRDLEAKEAQWYIPDELLGDEKTRKWHAQTKNFDSFVMLSGSGVLLAEKTTHGRSKKIFRLIRGADGLYRIEDPLGNPLIYRTQGGVPLVAGSLGEGSYLIDPGTGKLVEGYRSDFGATGRLIGPEGKYVNEAVVERKFLGEGKKGKPRLQIEGETGKGG